MRGQRSVLSCDNEANSAQSPSVPHRAWPSRGRTRSPEGLVIVPEYPTSRRGGARPVLRLSLPVSSAGGFLLSLPGAPGSVPVWAAHVARLSAARFGVGRRSRRFPSPLLGPPGLTTGGILGYQPLRFLLLFGSHFAAGIALQVIARASPGQRLPVGRPALATQACLTAVRF
jgi:hypothetical protein